MQTGWQEVRDDRDEGWVQEGQRETEQLAEVITRVFISIKMSPQRRNWWSRSPMSNKRRRNNTCNTIQQRHVFIGTATDLSFVSVWFFQQVPVVNPHLICLSHNPVCVCARVRLIVALVGVCPHSVCVCVILRQERHRLLHMKCYSYKAAVAWLSPRCSARQAAGETQQNKSQQEITDFIFFSFFCWDHLFPTTWAQNVYSCCVFASELAMAAIDRARNAFLIFENIRPDMSDLCGLQNRHVDVSAASVLPGTLNG